MIPRWRSPAATAREGELSSLRSPPSEGDLAQDLVEQEAAWEQFPSLHFATDLVSAALVVGPTPTALEAARFILNSAKASSLAQDVAKQILGLDAHSSEPPDSRAGDSPYSARSAIRTLKARLTRDPRNALAWAERARFHTIEGQSGAAERAMRVALALEPTNRYILRAACRLAIHDGEFERAHRIISHSPATPNDPWLLATEIAAGSLAGKDPRSSRRAMRVLDSGTYTARATSELAGALGTLELNAGSNRNARRLFTRSLSEPTENSIAQGEWASKHVSGIFVPEQQLVASWEARARRDADEGRSRDALAAAWHWFDDQPFSSTPAEFGTYQASLDQDFLGGIEIARAGLRANPGEFLLNNNYAFCLIGAGELDAAREVLDRIDSAALAEDARATFYATSGLYAFRRGDLAGGRKLYQESIAAAKDRHTAAVALIMLAHEEWRARTPLARMMLQQAWSVGKQSAEHRDLDRWLQHLPPVD
jgi:Tfp pilus assembly protein PilF